LVSSSELIVGKKRTPLLFQLWFKAQSSIIVLSIKIINTNTLQHPQSKILLTPVPSSALSGLKSSKLLHETQNETNHHHRYQYLWSIQVRRRRAIYNQRLPQSKGTPKSSWILNIGIQNVQTLRL